MRTCLYLTFLVVSALIFCGCSRSIVIPDEGANHLVVPSVTDKHGHKLLDLSNRVDRIIYHNFYIQNPQDDRFRVYMSRNKGDYAEWLVMPPAIDFEFSCHALRERQKEIYNTVDDLHMVYKKIWRKHPYSFAFDSKVIFWNGVKVIRFQEKGRNPRDGRLIYTDGFALPDPLEQDHIIEVKYIRCAYAKDMEKYGMRELGELFLKSVFIGNKR